MKLGFSGYKKPIFESPTAEALITRIFCPPSRIGVTFPLSDLGEIVIARPSVIFPNLFRAYSPVRLKPRGEFDLDDGASFGQ